LGKLNDDSAHPSVSPQAVRGLPVIEMEMDMDMDIAAILV
jgi:hypothetical protein